MIQIDMEMPKCCDECFALDDQGDYPYCLISQDQRGYTFNVRENRMPSCPLKAQEARVVKISELASGEPMLVWLEDIGKKETVAGMIFDYVPGRFGFKLTDIGSMDRIYPRIEDYLTRWRCWTSRPTDEQREATPWN